MNVSVRQNTEKPKLHVSCPNMVCCAAFLDGQPNFWTVCPLDVWHQRVTQSSLLHRARKRNRILRRTFGHPVGLILSFVGTDMRSKVSFKNQIIIYLLKLSSLYEASVKRCDCWLDMYKTKSRLSLNYLEI